MQTVYFLPMKMEKKSLNVRNNFEILSRNIISLSKIVDALSYYLRSNNPNPSVIDLSETLQTNETQNFKIDSYQSFFASPFKNKKCGVAIFV